MFKKKGEYLLKRLCLGPNISCVPSKKYAKRFKNFMVECVVTNYDDQEQSILVKNTTLIEENLSQALN